MFLIGASSPGRDLGPMYYDCDDRNTATQQVHSNFVRFYFFVNRWAASVRRWEFLQAGRSFFTESSPPSQ